MKLRTICMGLLLISTNCYPFWDTVYNIGEFIGGTLVDTAEDMLLGPDNRWKRRMREKDQEIARLKALVSVEQKNTNSNATSNPVTNITLAGQPGDGGLSSAGSTPMALVNQPASTASNTTPVDSKAILNHNSPTNININISNGTPKQEATLTTEEIKKTLHSWYDSSSNFIHENTYWIIGGTVALTYALTYYKVHCGNRYLEQTTLWSSWYEALELDELMQLDQSTITQELMKEIQYRYTQLHNPTDLLTPLTKFMQDIDAEMATLESYKSMHGWMNTLFLGYILPLYDTTYGTIDQRLMRLDYLKKIFLAWSTQYKLELYMSGNAKPHSVATNNFMNTIKRFTRGRRLS